MPKTTVPREELIAALIVRDGSTCQYPGCGKELDFSIRGGPREPSIDHWTPKWYGRQEGWTEEEIWDLSNLRLMEKRCNAKKSGLLPREDGTLPGKTQTKFRYRRDKRASRPELCEQCDNGHNLFTGEYCASCGCNAQRYPRWAKVKPNECSHDITWCWLCSVGIIERPSSIGIAMRQADSDELGEMLDEDYIDALD